MPSWRLRRPENSGGDHAPLPGDRPGDFGNEGHRGRRGRACRLDRRGRGATGVSGRRRSRAGPGSAVRLCRQRRPESPGAGRRSRRGRGPRQPGRNRAGVGPRHRAPVDTRSGVAGPPGRVDLRAAVGIGGHRRAAHRSGARPLLLRAEDGMDPGEHDDRRCGHHHRHLAGAPVVRGVRHRRIDGQPVTADLAGLRCSGTTSWSACSV